MSVVLVTINCFTRRTRKINITLLHKKISHYRQNKRRWVGWCSVVKKKKRRTRRLVLALLGYASHTQPTGKQRKRKRSTRELERERKLKDGKRYTDRKQRNGWSEDAYGILCMASGPAFGLYWETDRPDFYLIYRTHKHISVTSIWIPTYVIKRTTALSHITIFRTCVSLYSLSLFLPLLPFIPLFFFLSSVSLVFFSSIELSNLLPFYFFFFLI